MTFLPAPFHEWAVRLVESADLAPGQSVLDVACGTGIVARTAAQRLGTPDTVVGVDIDEAALTVARRLRPDIRWQHVDAADLPFEDDSFDVVFCQAALTFFADRVAALREMGRVAGPTGIVAVLMPARPGPYFAVNEPALHAELFATAGLEFHRARSYPSTTAPGAIDSFIVIAGRDSKLTGANRLDAASKPPSHG